MDTPIKFTLEEVPAVIGPNNDAFRWRLLINELGNKRTMYFRSQEEAAKFTAQYLTPQNLLNVIFNAPIQEASE